MNYQEIYDNLERLYPNAKCELNYNSDFELLVAVVLSAQTTDVSVNKVTKVLFEKYPDCYSLAKADYNDVCDLIKSIGLYKNKSKNIISLAQQLVKDYNGKVPNDFNELIKLSGVGRKTCNVVLSELFNYPALAVDTHVSRVAKRLAIANETDSVEVIEEKLCNFFPKDKWSRLHHLLIFFGRYKCKSQNPDCSNCPFISFCTYHH